MEFGKRLRELRVQSGLTQQQLGAQIGVTKSVISFYELQERAPSPEVLVKLASTFHVTTGLTDSDIQLVYSLIDTLRKKNDGHK